MRPFWLLTALAALPLLAADPAQNWGQWRGPELNGSSPTADNLPAEWSKEKNVRWRAALPSWSAATPIIWENTVFVTSAEEGFNQPASYKDRGAPPNAQADSLRPKDKIFLIALNRADGAERWRREIGGGNRIYRKHNLSSPSPVTDGATVWALTGGGELAAFSFATGKPLWARNIQKDYGQFGLNHGYASTPLLHDGRLYLQVLHGMNTDDPSYVFAVDKKTGKTIWKVDRPTDADFESPDDYSTPVLIEKGGKLQLVVSGGDYVTGHDLDTGKELWRMGGFNPNHERYYRTIASSVVVDDVVFTTSTRGKPFIAFRPVGEGDIGGDAVVWKNDGGSDVPTPTTDGALIYVVNDRGIASAYNKETGELEWGPERLEPGTYSSSPLLADGKIYATNEEGTTTVFSAGAEFKILAVNRLESHTLASPSAAGDALFIRTADYLYCIGKSGK